MDLSSVFRWSISFPLIILALLVYRKQNAEYLIH